MPWTDLKTRAAIKAADEEAYRFLIKTLKGAREKLAAQGNGFVKEIDKALALAGEETYGK